MLASLMPDEPEVQALLALMMIHHARREARFQGEDLVLAGDQDRSLWDREELDRGRALLDRAIALHGRGPYVLHAAIASLQVESPIDWPQIADLYGRLSQLTGSEVVELNRAVAVAESVGADEALAIVERLDLDDYQYFHSTRAELLRRLGHREEALRAYRRALQLAASEPERRFLRGRIEQV